MKLTRRKFFAGLVVAPLVPLGVALAAKLPVVGAPVWRKIHDGEHITPRQLALRVGMAEENEIYTDLLGYLEDTEEIT